MTNKSVSNHQNIGSLEANSVFSFGYAIDPMLPNNTFEFMVPYYSCILVLNGFGSFKDSDGRHALLSRGILVQRFPNSVHHISIDSTQTFECYYLCFNQDTFNILQSFGILQANQVVKKCPITKELLLMFDELSYEDQYKHEHPFYLYQKVLKCLHTMLTQTTLSPTFSTVIEKAKEILQSNFSIVYTEKDICDLLCIGQESFRKLFKKEVGISPMAYRNQHRMLAAKKLLASQSTIAEISEALGYSDSFSFSKQFKRHFGCPPTNFRKSLSAIAQDN